MIYPISLWFRNIVTSLTQSAGYIYVCLVFCVAEFLSQRLEQMTKRRRGAARCDQTAVQSHICSVSQHTPFSSLLMPHSHCARIRAYTREVWVRLNCCCQPTTCLSVFVTSLTSLSGPHKRNTTAIQEKILVLQLYYRLQVTSPKGHWSDIYVECNDQVNIITW